MKERKDITHDVRNDIMVTDLDYHVNSRASFAGYAPMESQVEMKGKEREWMYNDPLD